ISAGLWRDVNLEIKMPTRIEQVYWMTNSVDIHNRAAQLILDWQLSTDYPTVDGLSLEVSLKDNGETVYKNAYPLLSFCGRQQISLKDIDFWWPKGYGAPALYDATLRITDEKKQILDEKTQRIGIRTAE